MMAIHVEDSPSEKVHYTVKKITGGVILPIAFIIYSIYCWVTGTAYMIAVGIFGFGGFAIYQVTGVKAEAIAYCSLGLAIALHFQCIWKSSAKLWKFGHAGMLIGIFISLPALAFFIWEMTKDSW